MRTFLEKINTNQESPKTGETDKEPVTFSSFPKLKDVEQFLINKALKNTGGNQTQAARLLGISRKALNNRLTRNKTDTP